MRFLSSSTPEIRLQPRLRPGLCWVAYSALSDTLAAASLPLPKNPTQLLLSRPFGPRASARQTVPAVPILRNDHWCWEYFKYKYLNYLTTQNILHALSIEIFVKLTLHVILKYFGMTVLV